MMCGQWVELLVRANSLAGHDPAEEPVQQLALTWEQLTVKGNGPAAPTAEAIEAWLGSNCNSATRTLIDTHQTARAVGDAMEHRMRTR